jgi:energy-coupling factor transporter transmembrane protein EcfT
MVREQKKWQENLMKGIAYSPNVLINLFAIAIIALMTTVTFGIDLDFLTSWNFIITSFVLMLLFISIHWAVFDARIKALRNNLLNIEFKDKQEKEIEKITHTTEWANHKNEFINWRNEKNKIDAHKINIQNKLTKLREKAKPKDKSIELQQITELQRESLNDDELKELEIEYEKAKENNKYYQRKMELEEQLTDDWISKNIHKITIDYNEIDSQFVETGSVVKGIRKDKVNKKGKYLRDNGLNRVTFLLLTIAIGGITTDALINGGKKEDWALFAFRMILVVVNWMTGLNYGNRFYEEYDIHNLNSRVSITQEFKQYGLSKGFYTIRKGA